MKIRYLLFLSIIELPMLGSEIQKKSREDYHDFVRLKMIDEALNEAKKLCVSITADLNSKFPILSQSMQRFFHYTDIVRRHAPLCLMVDEAMKKDINEGMLYVDKIRSMYEGKIRDKN